MHARNRFIVAVTGVAGLAIVGFFMPKSQAVAQSGGPQVSIVSPLPLPVDVTNPPPVPFQTHLCTFGSPIPNCTDTLTVPAGKRLVIEYVSGSCISSLVTTAHSLHINTHVGGVLSDHRAFIQFIAADATLKSYAIAQQTRIYADPGTTVHVGVGGFPISGPTCSVALSGHHVTL